MKKMLSKKNYGLEDRWEFFQIWFYLYKLGLKMNAYKSKIIEINCPSYDYCVVQHILFFLFCIQDTWGYGLRNKTQHLTEPLLISGLIFQVLSNMFSWNTFSWSGSSCACPTCFSRIFFFCWSSVVKWCH